jgi:hypothetical protein
VPVYLDMQLYVLDERSSACFGHRRASGSLASGWLF